MTIEERVETLERNLLRARLNQRRILTAAIAAVSLIGLISAATPEQAAPSELQAKRFVLLDKKGVIRASLDANDDAPGLELFDEQGKSRAIFYASKTQSGMTLRTASCDAEANIEVEKDSSRLGLWTSQNRNPVGCHLVADKHGSSLNLDDDKQARIGLYADGEMGAALDIIDVAPKRDKALLQVWKHGAQLEMYDEQGKRIPLGP